MGGWCAGCLRRRTYSRLEIMKVAPLTIQSNQSTTPQEPMPALSCTGTTNTCYYNNKTLGTHQGLSWINLSLVFITIHTCKTNLNTHFSNPNNLFFRATNQWFTMTILMHHLYPQIPLSSSS